MSRRCATKQARFKWARLCAVLSMATGSLVSSVDAAARSPAMTAVANQGVTRLVTTAGAGRVQVTLTTRLASPPESEPGHVSRCSGGRVTCSLVDDLDISIAGRRIEPPRQAMLLLADVNTGRVLALKDSRFEVVLDCGDAAAAYEARIFFDRRRITRVEVWASEAGMLEQVTDFRDLSGAFR